jgi:hypothetical protein
LATFATWEVSVFNGPKFWLPFVGDYRTFLLDTVILDLGELAKLAA